MFCIVLVKEFYKLLLMFIHVTALSDMNTPNPPPPGSVMKTVADVSTRHFCNLDAGQACQTITGSVSLK